MKKLTVLSMILLAALLVLTGCEEAGADLNVDGLMYVSGSGSEWNSDSSSVTYYNTGSNLEFSTISHDSSSWGSSEVSMADITVVSYVDPDASSRSKFLGFSQTYGMTSTTWRVYGTDAGSDVNGFAAGDTVTVAVDIWVPDLSAQVSSAWVELFIEGDPLDIAGDGLDTFEKKYEADPATAFENGTGGWITVTKDILIADAGGGNAIFDVKLSTGSGALGAPYFIYLDNLTITNVVTP